MAHHAALAQAVADRLLLRKAFLLLQQRDEHADHLRRLQEEDPPLRAIETFRAEGKVASRLLGVQEMAGANPVSPTKVFSG